MEPLEIPPGVVSTATMASQSNRWREANMVRWVDRRIKPIGGWEQIAYNIPMATKVKSIHVWAGNNGIKYTAYLCLANLYVDIAGELFDITPVDGIEPPYDDIESGGYGEDDYGIEDYGTPRSDREVTRPVGPAFKLDNWGEFLVAMTSVDGRLLYWDPTNPSTPAQAVENAPTGNRTFVVTPERMIIIFGFGGDYKSYGWCNSEDFTEWTPNTTTTAGSLTVEPAATIVSAKSTKDGTIFFTPISAYLIEYVGPPYYYGHRKLIDAVTPVSAQSVAAADTDAMWPSESGFWKYTAGGIVAVDCPIWNWLEDDINFIYSRYESFAVNIATFGEYWWFFPDSESNENSRYVMYNYIDDVWSMGRLARTAGVSSAYDTYPIMANNVNAFQHERGMNYPGAPELPWIESHVLRVDSGAFKGTFYQMEPDIDGSIDSVRFNLKKRQDRANSPVQSTPLKRVKPNGYVDFREGGRDFQLRIQSIEAGVDWTIGQHLVDLKKRGGR